MRKRIKNIFLEIFKNVSILALSVFVAFLVQEISAQEYSVQSYQITDHHRVDKEEPGLVGGFWGHHLGHMVRTSSQGLWYVDDSGTDVNRNPAINYHHFDGMKWTLVKSLTNPSTIQQNTATLAVGDTLYTYGVNIVGGYIEEAVFDSKTHSAIYNRKIRYIGPSTNYIGAAVSPNGTRVVWWTKVVDNNGPSDWVYIYNKNGEWCKDSIVTKIIGNDFSYVFVSFLNDSVFYVGGEIPGGNAPNWTYEVGAGKVVLGEPISGFAKMKGANTAVNDIWVNKENGDVHLFAYGPYGSIGYFYKSENGEWGERIEVSEIGSVSRWRFIDSPDGNLYLILSQNGFKFTVIPKAGISGKINFSNVTISSINSDEGFTSSYAIWPESPEFQTTPVGGINFAYPGNDYSYSNLLRHVELKPNDGSVLINVNIPNGNEVFEADFVQMISWYTLKSSGIDSLKLELSTDNGTTWKTVEAKILNTGKYNWKVPRISSTENLIRLSDINNSSIVDVSNAPFTIQYIPVVQKLPISNIELPTKDTTVLVNSLFKFKGIASDSDGYIVNYIWNMGNGQTIRGITKQFDYLYETPGKYLVTFTVQDNDNNFSKPDSIFITVENSTSVLHRDAFPNSWKVYNNFPNPFNSHTIIRYQSGKTSYVTISIYNSLGQKITTLYQGLVSAGEHSIAWSGKEQHGGEVPSGMYFVRFDTAEKSELLKIMLLR